MSTHKVLFTGGHGGSTAYAVVEEIKKQKKKWKLFWVGPEYTFEGSKSETFEKKVFPKLGVHFVPITTGRIQRHFTLWTIPALLKIPAGFWKAYTIIKDINPTVVVSFGGYAAYPLVVISWLFRIPVIIHEQTPVAGRANRFSSPFATKVALSRKSSQKYFPKVKSIVTGNPLPLGTQTLPQKAKRSPIPTIFVTGGKSGSKTLNDTFIKIVPSLVKKYKIIHQTGTLQFEEIKKFQKTLSVKNYEVYDILGPKDWVKALSEADVIVSRAGANTVSQLLIIKTPSILVPIPFSYLNEQYENAKFANDLGIAEVIDQKDFTSNLLLEKIDYMFKNWDVIKTKMTDHKSIDLEASYNVFKLIEEVLVG